MDGYRIHLTDAGRLEPAVVAGAARLLVDTARRGEAVGLPCTITESACLDQLNRVVDAAGRGDAGLAVAVTRSGEVIGCAQWTRSAYQTQRVLAVVDRVAVLPSHRGGGVGGDVVAAVCGHAASRQVEVLELSVRGNNLAAIALYERLGFRQVGRLPNVVAIGRVRHDVVLMCRESARPEGLDLLGGFPAGGGASLPRGVRWGEQWERTERLLLCRPRLTDADAYFAIHADPATNEHNPLGPLTDPAAARATLAEWARHWNEAGYGYWTVRDPADGAVLGFGGVKPPVRHSDFLNLYYRFRPEVWGRGYATEVGRAALALAARQAPGMAVVAQIRPSNGPSLRVAERLAMRVAGEVVRDGGTYRQYVIVP